MKTIIYCSLITLYVIGFLFFTESDVEADEAAAGESSDESVADCTNDSPRLDVEDEGNETERVEPRVEHFREDEANDTQQQHPHVESNVVEEVQKSTSNAKTKKSRGR
jgi:hypothetical protein